MLSVARIGLTRIKYIIFKSNLKRKKITSGCLWIKQRQPKKLEKMNNNNNKS